MKIHRVMRRFDSVPAALTDNCETGNGIVSPSVYDDVMKPTPLKDVARMYSRSAVSLSRLVSRSGECNVQQSHVTNRKRKYLADLFTTAVDMRWRWQTVMAVAAFMVTWIGFGVGWLAIAHVRGDTKQRQNKDWTPCVDNVYDFRSALLFSIETQTTIGYGYRVISRHCPEAIILLMVQFCIGAAIQALVTGVIFTKLVRPKRRSETIMFSKRAVICKRDGEYQLMFRVGDVRRSHMVGTSIRALLVRSRYTAEGELIPMCQSSMSLEMETGRPSMGGATQLDPTIMFLVWPITVVHHINSSSPLWNLSLQTMLNGPQFEIVVILEGTIESTGMLAQVRTSYTTREISWGERLCPLVTYHNENGRYEIDFTQFHTTKPVAMPECSAAQWAKSRHQTSRRNPLRKVLSVAEEDGAPGDGDDYSVSFTIQAPEGRRNLSSSVSGSVWNLFNRTGRPSSNTETLGSVSAGNSVVAKSTSFLPGPFYWNTNIPKGSLENTSEFGENLSTNRHFAKEKATWTSVDITDYTKF